jgi:hypothetical protein
MFPELGTLSSPHYCSVSSMIGYPMIYMHQSPVYLQLIYLFSYFFKDGTVEQAVRRWLLGAESNIHDFV